MGSQGSATALAQAWFQAGRKCVLLRVGASTNSVFVGSASAQIKVGSSVFRDLNDVAHDEF